MTVVAGKPGGWRKVSGTPCESHDCGVLGGGFRATSRVTVWSEGDSAMLGFSWENLHTAPQAFVARLRGSTLTNVRQVSSLNAFAAHRQWPAVSVRTWHSDDGSAVEGLFIHAVNHSSTKPPPLIVFTHCGPAMASLSTFIGAGSVCARFPLAIWYANTFTSYMAWANVLKVVLSLSVGVSVVTKAELLSVGCGGGQGTAISGNVDSVRVCVCVCVCVCQGTAWLQRVAA